MLCSWILSSNRIHLGSHSSSHSAWRERCGQWDILVLVGTEETGRVSKIHYNSATLHLSLPHPIPSSVLLNEPKTTKAQYYNHHDNCSPPPPKLHPLPSSSSVAFHHTSLSPEAYTQLLGRFPLSSPMLLYKLLVQIHSRHLAWPVNIGTAGHFPHLEGPALHSSSLRFLF